MNMYLVRTKFMYKREHKTAWLYQGRQKEISCVTYIVKREGENEKDVETWIRIIIGNRYVL